MEKGPGLRLNLKKYKLISLAGKTRARTLPSQKDIIWTKNMEYEAAVVLNQAICEITAPRAMKMKLKRK